MEQLELYAPNASIKHKTDLFDTWTEESAYLLGYLEADGQVTVDGQTIRVYFQCSDKDIEYLMILKNITESTGTLGISNNWAGGKKYKKVRFTISSRAWARSPLIKQLRTGMIAHATDWMHHYIRGYFDGDGSVFLEKQSGKIKSNFVFSSENLAKEFKIILANQGIKASNVHIKTSSNKCWYFNISYGQTIKLRHYLYKDSSVYMNRKYQKFLQCDKIATEPKEG